MVAQAPRMFFIALAGLVMGAVLHTLEGAVGLQYIKTGNDFNAFLGFIAQLAPI